MVNISVCNDIIATLTTHPELHDQSTWTSPQETQDGDVTEETCGTTGCIAGWASIKYFNLQPAVRQYEGGWREFFYAPPRGHDWESAGCEALDIESTTGNMLFYIVDEEAAISALRDLRDGVDEATIRRNIRNGEYSE